MAHLLSQVATDLTIRSEVESTLSSILQDIETAHHLENTLHQNNEVQILQRKLEALQARYDEREAAWEMERREKERLGVKLMEEVLRLSAREVVEERERKQLERMVESKGQGVLVDPSSLVGSGDVNIVMQRPVIVEQDNLEGRKEKLDGRQSNVVNIEEERKMAVVEEKQGDTMTTIPEVTDNSAASAEAEPNTDAISPPSGIDETQMESNPNATNMVEAKINETQQPQPQEQQQQPELLPHDLDETTLMTIFAFLDPLEIINFAQTNKKMLAKIDVLFGTGGSSNEIEEEVVAETGGSGADALPTSTEQSAMVSGPANDLTPAAVANPQQQRIPSNPPAVSENSTATEIPSAAKTQVSNPQPTAPPNQAATAPSTSTMDVSNPQPASIPSAPVEKPSTTSASPKLFAMPSPSLPPGASTFTQMFSRFGATTTTPATAMQVMSASSSVSSAGTANASTTTAPPSSITTTTNTAASTGPTDTYGSEIKLNAAMANSMASKLSPAELSIILRMREKLQKCEAEAERWRLEKEDVVANLASVEAVKEFLVARVRDTEKVVQKQKEEMEEMRRKNLADQEVIVFLDDRVKGLEKEVEDMKLEVVKTRSEAKEMVHKNDKKVRVLSDMLRFEREQMAANEKEWKAAKKVLVKEVKSCRGRIVALEAEHEGARQQNAQLKEGLVSLSHSGSPGFKPGKKGIKFR